ncbi:TPA: capsular biosynthesis protein [Vibrio vulnificus]|nr:capsular biosynthesis protein [Vibrio vulnificus]
MFLIMSAAYVGQELESEFGKLPPSFLPLGNKRLFQHQIKLAPDGTDVFLSIPETFSISAKDSLWLEKNNVTVLQTPENLSLGASLVAALNLSGQSLDKSLHVLYGDTLYKELPLGDDLISISQAKGSYNWARFSSNEEHWLDNSDLLHANSESIIDGYFNFSNPRKLIKYIIQSEWEFINALNLYHDDIGLEIKKSIGWLDFGHVNTYYNSKAEFTTQRAFNELKITSRWIEKTSIKNKKIEAEAYWFENIPFDLRGYTPQFLGRKECNGAISYRLEYLHLTALNELFVFSKLPNQVWRQILIKCIDFIKLCSEQSPTDNFPENSLEQLFLIKTKQRLNEYCQSKNIDIDKRWIFNDSISLSLRDILTESTFNLPESTDKISVIHGDFCFSNILYDFRADKIKTVDPRGISPNGEITIYGDVRYDISKLSHSIIGLYDWIIAGYYDLEINDYNIKFKISDENIHKDTQMLFIKIMKDEFFITEKNLYAMQIQLFLSMLPLHSDDELRQQALLSNAFRLHEILIGLDK